MFNLVLNVNIVIFISNILVFLLVKNNSNKDPNEIMKEIDELINSNKDEKYKENIINFLNFLAENPTNIRIFMFLLFFTPVINILILYDGIKEMLKTNTK